MRCIESKTSRVFATFTRIEIEIARQKGMLGFEYILHRSDQGGRSVTEMKSALDMRIQASKDPAMERMSRHESIRGQCTTVTVAASTAGECSAHSDISGGPTVLAGKPA
jgi:hypothetical protein